MQALIADAWIVSGCLTQTSGISGPDARINYGIDDYGLILFRSATCRGGSRRPRDRRLRETSALSVRIGRNQHACIFGTTKAAALLSPPAERQGIDRFSHSMHPNLHPARRNGDDVIRAISDFTN